MTMPRLLKMRLQAVYVAEVDGELVEVSCQPMELPAAQWRALDPAEFASSGAADLAKAVARPSPQPRRTPRQQQGQDRTITRVKKKV